MANESRYHFNPATGRVGKCTAKNACPLGGESDHFDTAAEARQGYEAHMNATTDALQSVQADVSERRGRKQASAAMENGGWEGSGFAMNPYTAKEGRLYVDFNSNLWQVTEISTDPAVPGPIVTMAQVQPNGTLADRVKTVAFRSENYMSDSPDKFEEYELAPEEQEALAQGKSQEDILADSAEYRALHKAWSDLKNTKRWYGQPEDEMHRHNLDKAQAEAKGKMDDLAARLGYRPTSQRELDRKAMERPKGERKASVAAELGSRTYENVVVARVQYNKVRPGETPRNAQEAGTKILMVPNVAKLTKGRKAQIAEEILHQTGGRDMEAWKNLSLDERAKIGDRMITRYSSMDITVTEDAVDFSSKYNTSNGNPPDDFSFMRL